MTKQVENSGDPWLDFSNTQTLSYWNSLYMVIVTISTVGFGDITPDTALGKIFTIGAIVCGVVSIPYNLLSLVYIYIYIYIIRLCNDVHC